LGFEAAFGGAEGAVIDAAVLGFGGALLWGAGFVGAEEELAELDGAACSERERVAKLVPSPSNMIKRTPNTMLERFMGPSRS